MPASEQHPASKDEMYSQLGIINESLANLALRLERYHGELKEVMVELRTRSQAQEEKVSLNSERISLAAKKQEDDLEGLERNFTLLLEKQDVAHKQECKDLRTDIDELRQIKTYQNWIIAVLSAIFFAAMIYLNYRYGTPVVPMP